MGCLAGRGIRGRKRRVGMNVHTFDHAQTGTENRDEGDGAREDLAGLEIEAERRLVLRLAVVSYSPAPRTEEEGVGEGTNNWARSALECFGQGLAGHHQGNVVYQGLDIAGWCVV